MSRTDMTLKRTRVMRSDLNFFEKINESAWENGPFFMLIMAGLVFIIPQMFEILLVLWWIVYKLHLKAPWPEIKADPLLTKQSGKSPLFSMGMEINLKKPVWFSDTQMRQHLLVMGTTGAGKSQPVSSRVLTPSGWRTMGSLAVGDKVIAKDGNAAEILGIYPQGELDIYEFTFADGRKARATLEHLWTVHHKHWRGKYKKGESRAGMAKSRNMTTEEILHWMERNPKGDLSIDLLEPDAGCEQDLPVDPYILGCLIGDGSISKTIKFTTADGEILDEINRRMDGVHEFVYSQKYDYYLRNVKERSGKPLILSRNLNDLGLVGKTALTKFIPKIYLESSLSQRLDLIRGLLDTDGTVGRHGEVSFSTSSHQLAKDFQELAWSLGCIANISQKIPTYTYKGEKLQGNISYRVHVRSKNPDNLFFLKRKVDKAAENQQYREGLKLRIESIEKVGKEEAQCIYIDHPDHLYITDDYVVTHNTELLLYLSTQAMAMGSGVIFVDGKGDVKTWFRLYSIARRLGLEENLRVLNFGTNIGVGELKYDLSNTLNIYTLGDAGQLKEMMSSLMAEAGGDNAMWKGRAESMMGSLLSALVDLRDMGEIQLSAAAIAEFMVLDKLASFETNQMITQLSRDEVKRYLDSLPGFRAGQQGRSEADKQHNFLTMQFTEILALLNNTYTHLMAFPLGEINMLDVIINRRSLYVMLPSMEKSSNSVKNLGKIIVQQIRAALSKTLGAGIKGTKAEKLDARPTTSTTPMLCILDEYGSYAVEGFGEVAAQARSIGFSACFAVQDWASLEKADSRGMEALRIWANTNLKVFMKVEDSKSTMPLVLERVKKGYVLQSSGKEYNRDSTLGGERAQATSGYHEVDRMDPQELFRLKDGGFFVVYEDRFHRCQAPWISNAEGAWKDADWVAPVRMVPCPPPSRSEVAELVKTKKVMSDLDARLDDPNLMSGVQVSEAMQAIEGCWHGIQGDVNTFDADDNARRGLIFVRNFLRNLLQMAASQARRDFGQAPADKPEASETRQERKPRESAEDIQKRMQNVNPSSVPWNSANPELPDDEAVDEEYFTETEDDEPVIDTSMDPDIGEHPEDLNNDMPKPSSSAENADALRDMIADSDSETGKFTKSRVSPFLEKRKYDDEE